MLAVLVLLLPASARAGTFRVFGPQDFLRGTGAPVTETRRFTVPNPATTFTLTIYNGGMQDSEFETVNDVPATVTAGTFTVGVPLALSSHTLVAVATDLAGHTGSASRTITLDTTPPVVRILSRTLATRVSPVKPV